MVRTNSIGFLGSPRLTGLHDSDPVLTYYEMMHIVLKYKNRYRPILSLPYAFGTAQGFVMEKLPENIFTLSRDQVKQLKLNNTVRSHVPSFKDLVEKHTGRKLASVHDILPTYL